MIDYAQHYLEKGWNVLLPTMGGYPGSEPVDGGTSEASSYQDVEAIKIWLEKEKKVKTVGYHGVSIGGTLAFQAAAPEETNSSLKPAFLIG